MQETLHVAILPQDQPQPKPKEKCALPHKYLGYFYNTKTIVFTVHFAIKRANSIFLAPLFGMLVYLTLLVIRQLTHTVS